MTIARYIAVFIFAVAINISDIKSFKIKNKSVLIMLIVGLVLNIIDGNIKGALFGMIIPLVLFPLYALRMLGAGDVKALCAIGAAIGFRESGFNIIFTFIAGGIIALAIMIINKTGRARLKNLWLYLKMCILTGRPQSYDFGGGEKAYFRFSFAIMGGFILTVLNHYFKVI